MTEQERKRLLLAVQALVKTVERSLLTDTYEGIAEAVAQNYRDLHAKIAEQLPDDYYVTDVLRLNIPDGADERQQVVLVQLAASQLATYLKNLESLENPQASTRNRSDIGRDLGDEIARFTKETLRRALSNIDIDIEPPSPPDPPPPPKSKPGEGKVKIDLEWDDEDDTGKKPPPGSEVV